MEGLKILEAKYEGELEFPGGGGGGGGGGGAKQKKPSVGEYGYFLELHITSVLRKKGYTSPFNLNWTKKINRERE